MSSGSRDEDRPTKLEVFNGTTHEYKRWRRKAELHLLGLPSNVGKTKWGARLLEALSGEPWELLESMSIKDITEEDGYEKIFQTLDAKYAERAERSSEHSSSGWKPVIECSTPTQWSYLQKCADGSS